MNIIFSAEIAVVLSSVAGLLVCWRDFIVNRRSFQHARLIGLCLSSFVGLLPLAFHLLQPSHSNGNMIEEHVYSIGALVFLSIVACPSAIALYYVGSKRFIFFVFCISTLGVTSGTILVGLATIGVGA